MGMAESKVIELKWPWLLFFFSPSFLLLLFTGHCNALVENMFTSIAMWILVFGKNMRGELQSRSPVINLFIHVTVTQMHIKLMP